MKITLIHGEDIEANSQTLTKLINSYKSSPRIFNAKKDTSVSNLFRTQELFEDQFVYVIECAESLKDTDLKWLKENDKQFDCVLVLLANREMTQSMIKKLPLLDKVYKNEIPVYLWKLLDSIQPGNSKTCLTLLQVTTRTEPIEKVFALIVNQIKDIYMTLLEGNSLNYPSWRLSKLKSTASKFEISNLGNLISDLAVIDNKSKSGDNLYQLLSFSLIKYL